MNDDTIIYILFSLLCKCVIIIIVMAEHIQKLYKLIKQKYDL